MTFAEAQPIHYREAAATVRTGTGFFRDDSRPSRDLGVLLAVDQRRQGPLAVLDLMAGCGIRAVRYGLEAGAASLWVNDADPDRLPLLQANLAQLPEALPRRCSSETAQSLLAGCVQRRQRFQLVDLDAFGCPTALVPWALETVSLDGVLYLASSDGRSPTGHDRRAAVRRLGAAARAHPASWELALRLQLGVLARSAWALGHGLQPLLSTSEGRTFRTAIRLTRSPQPDEEASLGLLAHCHRCGDQQVQSLLRLGPWRACGCPGEAKPAISGPLWIGRLQDSALLRRLEILATGDCHASVAPETLRLLRRLAADPGLPVPCWPLAELARSLGRPLPRRQALLRALQQRGYTALSSGVMAAQIRSDAPWETVLAVARNLGSPEAAK
ncbi:MAG: N2,N2-dimethylguanosine tRNA methyltransferase [Synechococcaceae cyanobacterium]|nr:N2,N2-dimethylguanosine tRNA methyltransferase [Synechococcaceae cyanobacterium]